MFYIACAIISAYTVRSFFDDNSTKWRENFTLPAILDRYALKNLIKIIYMQSNSLTTL